LDENDYKKLRAEYEVLIKKNLCVYAIVVLAICLVVFLISAANNPYKEEAD